MFRKQYLFTLPVEDLDWVQWFRLALSKGPNRLDVFLLSSENGNRSSYRNVVFVLCIVYKHQVYELFGGSF
jgi:hypothetical protein